MKKFIYLLLLAVAGFSQSQGQPASGESPARTIHLTKKDFLVKVADYASAGEWKYLGDKPAIIDFYADWCGPCKVIAPVLEELAAEYEGRIYIYKVDIDSEGEKELAALFRIHSIPYLLFIPMGTQPQSLQGAAPKAYLKEIIEKILLK
ncbi:MAG: thioredoxin [Tannerellaceae bacterium]|jgi:thioredoxin|nr:thioredoxin [Tannerellaceae bacterium]